MHPTQTNYNNHHFQQCNQTNHKPTTDIKATTQKPAIQPKLNATTNQTTHHKQIKVKPKPKPTAKHIQIKPKPKPEATTSTTQTQNNNQTTKPSNKPVQGNQTQLKPTQSPSNQNPSKMRKVQTHPKTPNPKSTTTHNAT